jgi:hypothetical protein
MGDSFYRVATLYLKEQHLAQAKVMFARAVLLGPDAEYIRDAKKQLSALDANFAGDPSDRHETKAATIIPGIPRDTGKTAGTKPKSDTEKATTTNTTPANNGTASSRPTTVEAPKVRPKAKETAVETTTTPSSTGNGINITTDESGLGVVADDQSQSKKKKNKKKKEKKEKSHSDVARSAQPASEDVAKTAAPQAEDTAKTPAPIPAVEDVAKTTIGSS